PAHKKLNDCVGDWDTVSKMWMDGPGSKPTETRGHSSIKWVLDGRFLLEEFDGEMPMPDATGNVTMKPYKGMGLFGHDNVRNMYVANWANNRSRKIVNMPGKFDQSGKVLTMYGEMDEPMLDVHGRMVKFVWKTIDKNKKIFEVYDLHAGADYKVFEITYM